MQLFLIRHGIAIDELPGLTDEDRYLTGEGRNKTAKVAALLGKQIGHVDRILTSPLVRAVQTAEIVAQRFACEDVRVCPPLAPGGTLARVDAAIAESWDAGRLAIVGHEPSMSTIAAHLLGLPAFPRPFKKAGVCALELDEPGAVAKFTWFIVPKGPRVQSRLEAEE